MSRLTANFLLLTAAIIWGLGFVAQETAMDDIGPFQFVGLRFLLAAIVVAPFAILEIRRHSQANITSTPIFTSTHYSQLFYVGLIFFVAMSFQQLALLGTSVTNTGMLTGLYVLFVPLLAIVLYSQKQPYYIIPCAIIAFTGIWLLGGGGIDRFTWGDVLAFTCAIFWALHVIVIGDAVQKFGFPVTFAAVQFGVCGILGTLVFFILRYFSFTIEPSFSYPLLLNALPEVLFAAIFAGGLAFTLQAIAQRHTTATVAAVLLSGESLVAAIGGALILSERLDILGYIGCLCLLIAITSTSYFSSRGE